jgi:hypothetical protein
LETERGFPKKDLLEAFGDDEAHRGTLHTVHINQFDDYENIDPILSQENQPLREILMWTFDFFGIKDKMFVLIDI